jgi:hypothetical protein
MYYCIYICNPWYISLEKTGLDCIEILIMILSWRMAQKMPFRIYNYNNKIQTGRQVEEDYPEWKDNGWCLLCKCCLQVERDWHLSNEYIYIYIYVSQEDENI